MNLVEQIIIYKRLQKFKDEATTFTTLHRRQVFPPVNFEADFRLLAKHGHDLVINPVGSPQQDLNVCVYRKLSF